MRSSSLSHRENGLSLVELMIAITLGLLITAAIITLFVNTSRTNREMAKTNAQIESGRFAIQLIQNDVAHAGFWGGYIPDFDDLTAKTVETVPTAVPEPCEDYSSWNTNYKNGLIAIPLQAYDGIPNGCESIVTNKRANTDVLIVRHAATCIPDIENCEGENANKLYFQVSNCKEEEEEGDKYLLDKPNFTLHEMNCTTPVKKRKYTSYIYYVRDCSNLNPDGSSCADDIPTLVRAEFDLNDSNQPSYRPPEPLINGIEGFRVEIGVDNISDDGTNIVTGVKGTNPADMNLRYDKPIQWSDPDNWISPVNRGDGAPDEYVRCPSTGCDIEELVNAVTLKVYVLARSEEPTVGYIDNKIYSLGSSSTMCSTASTESGCALKVLQSDVKRHVFTSTVRLNNVSGRRETP